jgi:hypothetical protein
MVDDIELAEAYNKDLAITRLTSHNEEENTFTKNDVLAVTVKNSGIESIKSNFKVVGTIDGKKEISADVMASKKPISSGEDAKKEANAFASFNI